MAYLPYLLAEGNQNNVTNYVLYTVPTDKAALVKYVTLHSSNPAITIVLYLKRPERVARLLISQATGTLNPGQYAMNVVLHDADQLQITSSDDVTYTVSGVLIDQTEGEGTTTAAP